MSIMSVAQVRANAGEAPKRFYLFVYGTLMKGYGLNSCLKDTKFIGKATIKGYGLYSWRIPVLIKSENPEEIVHGEIYEFDEYLVKLLLPEIDSIEGAYNRTEMEALTETGEILTVGTYVYHNHSIENIWTKVESGDFRKPNDVENMKKLQEKTWDNYAGKEADVYQCELCQARTKFPEEHKCQEEIE